MRLPKVGRKERGKMARGRGDAGYGGEEWRGLGEGAERVVGLTAKKGGMRGEGAALERSRKREREGGERRDGGERIGERWEKRKRMARRK